MQHSTTGTRLLVLVLAVVAVLIAGCSALASGPPPGGGTTVADSVCRAVRPRTGEQVWVTGGLTDRIAAVEQRRAAWTEASTRRSTESDDGRLRDPHVFRDGSVLYLVMNPLAEGQDGESYQTTLAVIEISRP